MPEEILNQSWTVNVEGALRTLRDVEGVSVRAEDDEIREIHILTTSARPAKQIVRDVQTLLMTRFQRSIDHRVVSVAFAQPGEIAAIRPDRNEPEPPPDSRIRFVSANLYVSGTRAQAQVELRWKGSPRIGTASGWGTRSGAHRMVAAATISAVQEYLDDAAAVSLEGIEIVRLGRREVVVVALELLAHREEKSLVGCCTVESDLQQAIVLATLNALNRIVGSLGSTPHEMNGKDVRPAST
jgi:hypothetical protein